MLANDYLLELVDMKVALLLFMCLEVLSSAQEKLKLLAEPFFKMSDLDG